MNCPMNETDCQESCQFRSSEECRNPDYIPEQVSERDLWGWVWRRKSSKNPYPRMAPGSPPQRR